MAVVGFHEISRVFPGGTVALSDLTLEVIEGEFLILVGPSGCGKTTALRLVAGLDKPTSGAITIGGRVVNDVSPRDRDIAMVFQSYALYPHMTVYKNLAFGLKERRVAKAEIERRVGAISSMLGLGDLLQRKPAQLSGGQRQRVAMGRALVRDPEVFLLDEPLSNLDAKLRVQMRAELKRLHQQFLVTTIYVTHDQVEAMTLGDRIAVISGGRLQQLGTPQEVYERPVNLFVAGFIGSPPMNLLRATSAAGTLHVGELALPLQDMPDGEVVVGLRPECLRPLRGDLNGQPSLDCHIEVVEPLGDAIMVHGTVSGRSAAGEDDPETHLLATSTGSRAPITARFDARERPAAGERVPLEVRPEDLHVFDAASGVRVR